MSRRLLTGLTGLTGLPGLPGAPVLAVLPALALGAGCARWEPASEWAPVVGDQGIDDSEAADLDRALDALLPLAGVDLVYTLRDGLYHVHARRGRVAFRRVLGEDGWAYEVVETEGTNPIANQDPAALPTVAEEIAAGSNPNAMDYSSFDPGYTGADDPRISFLDGDQVSFPLAYERIAALFDHPDAPDFGVDYQPWGLPDSAAERVVGAHGFLNHMASRAVLVVAGQGAAGAQRVDAVPAAVDVAPTAAAALGLDETFGLVRGRYRSDARLGWQDGRVLSEALSGAAPDHVVIVSNDALTNAELRHMIEETEEPLPAYRWLIDHGTWFRQGMTSNFPTNTYASQHTLCTGAWSAHHGLLDNHYFDRAAGVAVDPIDEVTGASDYLVDEVETLHEAVHRTFDNWHPETNPLGNFTAAINHPCGRDADVAIFELAMTFDWSDCAVPDKYEQPMTDPEMPNEQAGDDILVTGFAKLFVGTLPADRGGGRCTPAPRFTIVNLGLTDGASHHFGPHSDRMRRAIVATDARMQLLFDAVREAGVFDRTMWILVSDHGQSLQDHSRLTPIDGALEAAGIEYDGTMTFVYLR